MDRKIIDRWMDRQMDSWIDRQTDGIWRHLRRTQRSSALLLYVYISIQTDKLIDT